LRDLGVVPSLDVLVMIGWIASDPAEPLGGKWRLLVGKGGECDVES
jgi:hypothetical protein